MKTSTFWQHNKTIRCPKGHEMLWLGSAFWICGKSKCNKIYVQEERKEDEICEVDLSDCGPCQGNVEKID